MALAAACGGQPAPVVAYLPSPPQPAAAPAPKAQPARWVVEPGAKGDLRARLDIGGGSVLYVAERGRRFLQHGDGPLKAAPQLVPAWLAGALLDDEKRLVLVAVDGRTFVASDPMGPIEAEHAGPAPHDAPRDDDDPRADHGFSVATGRAAILVLLPDGGVRRSADYGRTWQVVDYAGGSPPFGKAVSIALDSKGNGLLVHHPQHVFVTHDDGATWSPLRSTGTGAESAVRDANDQLFVRAPLGNARLAGATLAKTSDSPERLAWPPGQGDTQHSGLEAQVRSTELPAAADFLCGDRVMRLHVAVDRSGGAVEVGSAPLGEAPVIYAERPELSGVGVLRSWLVATYGTEAVYLRTSDSGNSGDSAKALDVYHSPDCGTHWRLDAHFDAELYDAFSFSSSSQHEDEPHVATGPGGWRFVSGICQQRGAPSDGCQHLLVRTAGASTFQPMAFDLDALAASGPLSPRIPPQGIALLRARSFVFDEPSNRVYFVARAYARSFPDVVFESPLDENHFTPLKLPYSAYFSVDGVSIDAAGTVRTFARDGEHPGMMLLRLGASGEALGTSFLPFRPGPTLELAGARGLDLVDSVRGWETDDGGESWTPVAVGGTSGRDACGAAGCLLGDEQRVGWDLPARRGAGLVRVSAEPPAQEAPAPAPSPPPAGAAAKDLRCEVVGAPTPLPSLPERDETMDGFGRAAEWAIVDDAKGGGRDVVFGTDAGVRRELLEPTPAKWRDYVGARAYRGSVVAVRADAGGREVAWWSSASGVAVRARDTAARTASCVPAVPPTNDPGVVCRDAAPTAGGTVSEDGAFLTFDSTATRDAVLRGEGQWTLLDDRSEGQARLMATDDGGRTWDERAWSLGDVGPLRLFMLGDRPVLATVVGEGRPVLFPVSSPLTDDPPEPILPDMGDLERACGPGAAAASLRLGVGDGARPVQAHLALDGEDATYVMDARVVHVTAGEHLCTSSIELRPEDSDAPRVSLHADARGWSGWWLGYASLKGGPGVSPAARRLRCTEVRGPMR